MVVYQRVNAEHNGFKKQARHLVTHANIQICNRIIEAIVLLLAPAGNPIFNADKEKKEGEGGSNEKPAE